MNTTPARSSIGSSSQSLPQLCLPAGPIRRLGKRPPSTPSSAAAYHLRRDMIPFSICENGSCPFRLSPATRPRGKVTSKQASSVHSGGHLPPERTTPPAKVRSVASRRPTAPYTARCITHARPFFDSPIIPLGRSPNSTVSSFGCPLRRLRRHLPPAHESPEGGSPIWLGGAPSDRSPGGGSCTRWAATPPPSIRASLLPA